MITIDLFYKNKAYECRIVKSNEDEDLIIAGTSLMKILMPFNLTNGNNGFANLEAERVDEEIFFYINDDDLKLPDKELIERLKVDSPEWFD